MLSVFGVKALAVLLVMGAGRSAPDKDTSQQLLRIPAALELTGTAVSGETISVKRHLRAGSKAVVISFLNPTNPDTKRELYPLRKLYLEWRDLGVALVQVGLDTDRAALQAFVNDNAVLWPVVFDPQRIWATALEADRAPTVVVVGRGGRIFAREQGYSPSRYGILRKALAAAYQMDPPWGAYGNTPPFLRARQHYRFGRAPSALGAATRWEPLAAHLTRSSHAFIKMASSEDYKSFEADLKGGFYEIVNVGPLLASRVLEQYEPIATLERGKRQYKGVIFTLERTKITKLEGLRGKTIALVSPTSSSGGVYPFARLLDAGLTPEEDINIMWLGTHGKVARAVRSGQAVAGGCFEGCQALAWRDSEQRDKETVVLARTEKIPAELILVRRDLPVRERAALRRALLVSSKAAAILGRISGTRPITKVRRANEQTLSGVRRIYRNVRASLDLAVKLGKQREEREAEIVRQTQFR